MGLLNALKKKKAQIDKMDETYYLPEDIDKNDELWKLRTINDIIIAMCGRMTRKSSFGENMNALSAEERPLVGKIANQVRAYIEEKLEAAKTTLESALSAQKLKDEKTID